MTALVGGRSGNRRLFGGLRAVLRRLLPDGLAARTAFTVVGALALAQALSLLLFLADRNNLDQWHTVRTLPDRVVIMTQVLDALPPADRPAAATAMSTANVTVRWTAARPPIRDSHRPPFDPVRERMHHDLGTPMRHILIAPPDAPGGTPGVMTMAVTLRDGSWIMASATAPWTLLSGPWHLLVRIGLVGLAIAAVSIWAAGRLAAPLARFAAAAERFGVDTEAPLLPEAGPRELRTAIRAFNRMQTRLRRFIDDRTSMLAAISHDLRTPLTRLRLRAEFVEDEEQQRKMLDDLAEMEAMIRASLSFARDDGRSEPRIRVDLADMLQSLCDNANDAGHAADYAGPPHRPLTCRPMALRRAFSNLIDNAIGYGGAAHIRLHDAGTHLTVEIADEGPGIPDTEREKVFTAFYRLERSRSRATGGSGLGLTIARTMVRAHGGDITLDTAPGGGLLVRVSLPAG